MTKERGGKIHFYREITIYKDLVVREHVTLGLKIAHRRRNYAFRALRLSRKIHTNSSILLINLKKKKMLRNRAMGYENTPTYTPSVPPPSHMPQIHCRTRISL